MFLMFSLSITFTCRTEKLAGRGWLAWPTEIQKMLVDMNLRGNCYAAVGHCLSGLNSGDKGGYIGKDNLLHNLACALWAISRIVLFETLPSC